MRSCQARPEAAVLTQDVWLRRSWVGPALVLASLLAAGCGGDDSGDCSAVLVEISTPLPGVLLVGTPALAIAHVRNDEGNLGVDWTLSCGEPKACGSITRHTGDDEPAIYLAPAFPPPQPVVVAARSTADASRAASQTVQVRALPTMAR